MSVMYCDRCSDPVDTDEDPEALAMPAANGWTDTPCLCEYCRERRAIQSERP